MVNKRTWRTFHLNNEKERKTNNITPTSSSFKT